MEKQKTLEDIFIIGELEKIKRGKYYTQPIMTEEEWRKRYPAESEAEIPTYIPTWSDLDEIIYQKEGLR